MDVLSSIWRWVRARRRAKAPGQSYKVFTRGFDRTVDARELASILGPLSSEDELALNEAWAQFLGALQGWRTGLHLKALEASARIRTVLSGEVLSDTVVTLLIDQSGSMRGQSMLLAAASADVAQNFILHLGSAVEVLGFTTTSWHGGDSRRRWKRSWRPSNPGRLCDLLHIIYQPAGRVGTATGGPAFKPMLRPDLPKENVDGEALEWAAERLRAHPNNRKILVVVSDGAPVDDATLIHNHPSILHDHLKLVVKTLEAEGEIELAAIGIGFDVERYYATCATVKLPEDLGEGLLALLERVIIAPSKKVNVF